MSKNMNKRLFYMFITRLSKTPRSQLLQLLPQIRVVNAFRSSVKGTKTGPKSFNNASSGWTSSTSNTGAAKEESPSKKKDKEEDNYFSPKKDESPEKKEDIRDEEQNQRRRKCRYGNHDDEDEDKDDVSAPCYTDIKNASRALNQGSNRSPSKSHWNIVSGRIKKY